MSEHRIEMARRFDPQCSRCRGYVTVIVSQIVMLAISTSLLIWWWPR